MSKSLSRRNCDPEFAAHYFVGHGLDVGCGPDPLRPSPDFPGIVSVQGFDRDNYPGVLSGDAETLANLADNSFDFVVSAHCLEHMVHPDQALTNWLRVLQPGGHLIVTIPDWELYEHRQWPSRFNGDHKWAWTLNHDLIGDGFHVIYVPEWLAQFCDTAPVIVLRCIEDHYDSNQPSSVDQTGGPAECAIEFVLQANGK